MGKITDSLIALQNGITEECQIAGVTIRRSEARKLYGDAIYTSASSAAGLVKYIAWNWPGEYGCPGYVAKVFAECRKELAEHRNLLEHEGSLDLLLKSMNVYGGPGFYMHGWWFLPKHSDFESATVFRTAATTKGELLRNIAGAEACANSKAERSALLELYNKIAGVLVPKLTPVPKETKAETEPSKSRDYDSELAGLQSGRHDIHIGGYTLVPNIVATNVSPYDDKVIFTNQKTARALIDALMKLDKRPDNLIRELQAYEAQKLSDAYIQSKSALRDALGRKYRHVIAFDLLGHGGVSTQNSRGEPTPECSKLFSDLVARDGWWRQEVHWYEETWEICCKHGDDGILTIVTQGVTGDIRMAEERFVENIYSAEANKPDKFNATIDEAAERLADHWLVKEEPVHIGDAVFYGIRFPGKKLPESADGTPLTHQAPLGTFSNTATPSDHIGESAASTQKENTMSNVTPAQAALIGGTNGLLNAGSFALQKSLLAKYPGASEFLASDEGQGIISAALLGNLKLTLSVTGQPEGKMGYALNIIESTLTARGAEHATNIVTRQIENLIARMMLYLGATEEDVKKIRVGGSQDQAEDLLSDPLQKKETAK